MSLETIARMVITAGVGLIVVGGILLLAARANIPLGRLPGDILIQRENFTCAFPVVTMILVSILLSVGLNILVRLLNR
jgi:hypothetical protein